MATPSDTQCEHNDRNIDNQSDCLVGLFHIGNWNS